MAPKRNSRISQMPMRRYLTPIKKGSMTSTARKELNVMLKDKIQMVAVVLAVSVTKISSISSLEVEAVEDAVAAVDINTLSSMSVVVMVVNNNSRKKNYLTTVM
jgi:hypothetical protein